MTAKLIAEEGLLKGLVLSMDEGQEWVIGRDPDEAKLVVADPSASRRHVICRNTDRGLEIENLSTTNPLFLNDEEIHGPRLLKQGDAVKIGNTLFRFYNETAAQVTDLTPPQEQPAPNESNESPPPVKEEESPMEVAEEEKEEVKHDSVFADEDELGPEDGEIAQVNFDLLDTSRWLLKVVAGPNNGAEFSMQPETSYVIGTDPATCDIVFHDVSVSRQHARITVSKEESLTLEDLKSRNGTTVDGKPIMGTVNLAPNMLVSMGTTTFLVYDREGERHTIISPLLPAIVKVLQQEEEKKHEAEKEGPAVEAALAAAAKAAASTGSATETPPPASAKNHQATSFHTLVFLLIATGLFVLAGMGTTLLFRTQTVEVQKIDYDKEIANALASFPEINWSFNKSTGKLLLIGHVLTTVDRNQLAYNLQGLTFINSIDDNIVVDEYIWQETNQILSKNPSWRGVALHSPAPGKFVLTGYLQTRKQGEQLSSYLIQNFPYLDRLDKKVIIEEDVLAQINSILEDSDFRDIVVKIANQGEVTISGSIPNGRKAALDKAIEAIRATNGVRVLKNFVAELPPDELIVNISKSYKVTGTSVRGNGQIMVVVNGRILGKGDQIDNMTVTEITPNEVFLERNGTKYRIDYK